MKRQVTFMTKKIMGVEYKTCSWCGNIKRIDEFHKATNKPSGYSTHCKKCNHDKYGYNALSDTVRTERRAYARAYYLKHKPTPSPAPITTKRTHLRKKGTTTVCDHSLAIAMRLNYDPKINFCGKCGAKLA